MRVGRCWPDQDPALQKGRRRDFRLDERTAVGLGRERNAHTGNDMNGWSDVERPCGDCDDNQHGEKQEQRLNCCHHTMHLVGSDPLKQRSGGVPE